MPQVRIPVAAAYNTRVSAVNASDTSGGYVGVGIVGVMIVGKTSASVGKDARFVNCFVETVSDPITGKQKNYTVKRPGFTVFNTPASGKKGYAARVWLGASSAIITAFDSPSTVYSGTSSLGAITGKATGITETLIGANATLAVSADDSTGWYYDLPTGVMTKIVNANFPGNAGKTLAGTFVHMDGYACIMATDGTIWASDLNSITSWTATSFGTHNAYPDGGIALVRSKNFVLAFGRESMEFWYNAGLTPFPLARANSMTLRVGAVNSDAFCQISDSIFWAGSTPQGGLSIFQYDGNLRRISTPEVDALLILAGAANLSLTSIRFYGRSFVLVSASTVTTYAYCVEEKFWSEWSTTIPLWYKCVGLSLAGTMVNYAVSNISTAGSVFIMNPASLVFTDNGVAYTARAQFPQMDLGTANMKFWGSVELIADRELSSSPITLSYTDDDYQTYQTWGNLDLQLARPQAYRLGASRKRGWVWTHAAATPMRLEAMELNVDVGES
jgi:hypothetical protein